MAHLSEIVQYLNQLLDPAAFKDSAYNGLQVDSGSETVRRVAFAVDAGLSVFKKAVAKKAQLLVVHHGIYWEDRNVISGVFGEKIRFLIKNGCSLYASHLPLDAHPEVGNNVELCRFFEVGEPQPFSEFHGNLIGFKGTTGGARPLSWFEEQAKKLEGAAEPLTLPFGKSRIESVGIVSGGAASAIFHAAAEKLDLLITGEATQWAYHAAREHRINVIFAGHYATETTGVLALQNKLEKEWGLSTVFVKEPTGI